MKKILEKLYLNSVNLNLKNIFSVLEENKKAKILDLGCDDGSLTRKLADIIRTDKMFGVDIVKKRIKIAEKGGIKVSNFDLNKKFKFSNSSFDVIHANQVIEHLHDADNFLGEIYRVLKPGGYAIISTENASSWCNIAASILGWQIFSLTNISSKKQGIGNPFSLHRGEGNGLSSWNHVRIYNIRGLKELLEAHGFKIISYKGSGYFPLPAFIGNLDKTHCHFMTFKVRKIK